jgi:hypothetical protein
MTAADVLKISRAAGISVIIDGDDIILKALVAPPQEMLDAIVRQKAEIARLLRLETAGQWSKEDWQCFFGERAAIAEFDGGWGRSDAELNAFEDCLDHWLAMHPPPPESEGLHPNCAPKWMVSRRLEARRTLAWLLG